MGLTHLPILYKPAGKHRHEQSNPDLLGGYFPGCSRFSFPVAYQFDRSVANRYPTTGFFPANTCGAISAARNKKGGTGEIANIPQKEFS